MNKNLLNWYKFKDNSSILEIFVDKEYLDISKNKMHLKDSDYIEGTYDYIVIINSLHFLNKYFANETVHTYVDKLKKSLKNNGHLIIGIQNELSVFNIIGYCKNNYSNSFTNKSINELSNGFSNNKIYYPYPDLDNVSEIYTNNTINSIKRSSISNPTDENIVVVHDEKKLINSFMEMNISQYFASSFLIDLSDDVCENNVDYIKISSNRRTEFQIFTYFDLSHKNVVKRSIYNNNKHLDVLTENKWSSGILHTIKYIKDSDNYVCRLLENKDLSTELLENLGNDNFYELVNKFKENVYLNSTFKLQKNNDDFNEVFGTKMCSNKLHWKDNGNADLTTNNIFIINNNDWIVVDHEWYFNFSMPAEYMVWYSIDYFIKSNGLDTSIDKKRLYEIIGITNEDIEVFEEWKNHFIYCYVGTVDPEYKAIDIVDLQEIYKLSLDSKKASEIINSKFWKASEPLRKLMDKFKGK